MTRPCSMDLWQLRSHRAMSFSREAGHEDDAVRARRAVGDGIGAVRAEYAGGVFFALADGSAVIQQRAHRRHADGQVRAQHVLAEIVEEHLRNRRLAKGRATQVSRRAEGVFVHVRLPQHGREHRRQQVLAVAAHGRLDPAGDERGRILGEPDELVGQLERAERDGRLPGCARLTGTSAHDRCGPGTRAALFRRRPERPRPRPPAGCRSVDPREWRPRRPRPSAP